MLVYNSLFIISKMLNSMFLQIIELPSHPYFVGVQFHPEFKSRPGKPSALFSGTLTTDCYRLIESRTHTHTIKLEQYSRHSSNEAGKKNERINI